MNSAPERTADEDGKHPKDQCYVRVSLFMLFKQLIKCLNEGQRLHSYHPDLTCRSDSQMLVRSMDPLCNNCWTWLIHFLKSIRSLFLLSLTDQNCPWSTSSNQEAGLAGKSGYPPLLPVERSELGPLAGPPKALTPGLTPGPPPCVMMAMPESGYTKLEMRFWCLGMAWSEPGDWAP